MTDLTFIEQYLIAQSQFHKKTNKDQNFRYKSFEELVLRYGLGFTFSPYPDDLEIGSNGHCYYNCLKILNKQPDLIYCEGYAFPKGIGIGLSHAWLINTEGKVIDPTPSWQDPKTIYYGITFNYDWLLDLFMERKAKTGEYYLSVFQGNYLEDFSLLKNDMPKEALNYLTV